ncbi:hypothetical protein [Actinoplanes sp. NPDC051494]|uniref:hypothetical protein n=1 Tax=Actinoplanes sp. NPDC051494 TaxID=3363907 RepID=UPI0037AB0292
MGINWDTPNVEAVDQMGLLDQWEKDHGEEDGFIKTVVDKIHADILADSNTTHKEDTGGTFERGDYDADELAAWDWYTEKYKNMDYPEWKKLVQQHQADEAGQEIDVTDPSTYELKTDGDNERIWPPSNLNLNENTYNGEGNQNNEMSVSTEAIQYLITSFGQIAKSEHEGELLKLATELEGKFIKPGGFARAELLRRKIDGTGSGDPGLRGDTIGLLRTLHRAIYEVQQGLTEMKKEYEKTEEDNEVTEQKLQEHMKDAWSELGALGGYGTVGGDKEA